MDKNTTVVAIVLVALVAGFSGGYVLRGQQTPAGYHMMSEGEMMDNGEMGMDHAMDDMMAGLNGKTGDELDKAFLTEMIVHHQGAVIMAEAVLQNAKHSEIRQMAENIISAQTKEIEQMRAWLKAWYK